MSLQERTLVIRGFDHTKLTHKLLKELCIQGGPVKKVVIRQDHAFVEYEDVESVAYSIALLDGVKLFGERLQIDPRVRSKEHFKYHQLLIDYINYDKQCKLSQQPSPLVGESQQSQSQPVIWETYQQQQQQQFQQQQQQLQQQQQQQQQQFMMNQQLLLQQQQQLQQPSPAGQFDVYGIFFQQQNNLASISSSPDNYQPPSPIYNPQEPSFPNQNFFVPNQQQHRHHSGNHNVGRSRSFNDHNKNYHNNQSNHRRQSAQSPNFKNRRR